ncbi:putative PurR-regulated permease PerM [Paucibacter oligotrophus]|uniref:Putative PurR-regulated permease PerM n=1 Tax=Roseateles oligotrophus TaxID=1769250 RepID=A0A840LFQ1_9BURK|nr:AI-2E family transporter YdiK [Roseateles oligotrophus]MBB4845462.1 putative PurR-regulated permease PerM [Roseateles oligotrophus]
MSVQSPKPELTRNLLALLSVALLLFMSLWVMRPFLGPLIWATMVVVSTWPMMRAVQARLWGRRGLATSVMVLVLLLLLFVPLSVALSTVVTHADSVVTLFNSLSEAKLPEPPQWLLGLPLVGETLGGLWHRVAVDGVGPIVGMIKPYFGSSLKWVASQAGNLGLIGMQFMMTVAIAAILYLYGESAARGVRGFALRLAGTQGDQVITLAGQAIRGVALGLVVTAMVQSALGGLGLLLVGVPFAGLLTAVMFMACLAQIGVVLVLGPAVAWLYWSGEPTWGTVLLVITTLITLLDNVLRPWLIKKGADLPLLLIFAGVIGGLLAFGLVGLFIGPVVLAVTYTLTLAWIGDQMPKEGQAEAKQS